LVIAPSGCHSQARMLVQFFKFFVNGGILGIAAWGLQWLIYKVIKGDSATAYSVATALTYLPLVVVNFLIQRRWIFNRPGLFWRFVLANLVIMIFGFTFVFIL
jgi:putative flippase GtrA